ncbi:unnamed protein product [Clonostachys rosea]|uniref:Uncharacterized protein n=1 Tax=Bionectria ochroleuca TaxID=29856 RepID=A0ABY6UER0_BIOOC|nr:unnamed protein product [Clonostachys rosea]
MAKKGRNRSQKAKADGQLENQPAAAPGVPAREENPLQQRSENITIESGRPTRRKVITETRFPGSSRTHPEGIPRILIKETSKTVPK